MHLRGLRSAAARAVTFGQAATRHSAALKLDDDAQLLSGELAAAAAATVAAAAQTNVCAREMMRVTLIRSRQSSTHSRPRARARTQGVGNDTGRDARARAWPPSRFARARADKRSR